MNQKIEFIKIIWNIKFVFGYIARALLIVMSQNDFLLNICILIITNYTVVDCVLQPEKSKKKSS